MNNSEMTARGICANLADPESDIRAISDAIDAAIKAERQRCLEVIAAEVEWGGNIIEARDMIERGDPPRVIPSWNAPYKDDEYDAIDDDDELLQMMMDRDRE